jgi:histidinol dehydrogenase
VAARLAGVDRVFKIGSAWAIAAMAFGTDTVPRVDKIVGPGNIYVLLAKRAVFGYVGIESLPGPSDVLIVADGAGEPRHIAADLLSQAEHGADSSAILVTPSAELIDAVEAELAAQLAALPRREEAEASLAARGALVLACDLAEAAAVANAVAPEHLEILVDGDAELGAVADAIDNAGAIFLGPHTPEPLGDYLAGPSHILPTEGTSRFASPLNVDDFLRKSSVLRYSREAFLRDAEATMALAEAEGLDAHARSVRVRL